jgi:hypothetical protein
VDDWCGDGAMGSSKWTLVHWKEADFLDERLRRWVPLFPCNSSQRIERWNVSGSSRVKILDHPRANEVKCHDPRASFHLQTLLWVTAVASALLIEAKQALQV